jgi:hypothetical protein
LRYAGLIDDHRPPRAVPGDLDRHGAGTVFTQGTVGVWTGRFRRNQVISDQFPGLSTIRRTAYRGIPDRGGQPPHLCFSARAHHAICRCEICGRRHECRSSMHYGLQGRR